MLLLDKQLNLLKLKRCSKKNIGKKMGKQLWFYKEYATEIIDEKLYLEFKNKFGNEFDFSVIRWNESTQEIVFIEAIDFLSKEEPTIGRTKKLKKENNEIIISKTLKQQQDPMIYHHKWMFVKDDFKGFDVEKSKKRSIEWKSILGVNKEISNKIGRYSYWNKWVEINLKNKVKK